MRGRAAAAGATAALVWAAQEPLDQWVFGCDYSDVAVLGKAVTRGPRWRTVGLAMHAANGAVFGLVYRALRRRTRVEPRRLPLGLALAEHAALYPLSWFVDRYHPARGEPGVPALHNRRALRRRPGATPSSAGCSAGLAPSGPAGRAPPVRATASSPRSRM